MKIYVGNLTIDTMESALIRKFERFGVVNSVQIIKDPKTGKTQGYAIIEMPDDGQAQAAINALNRLEFNGTWWTVKQARF
ncbi:RNA-binding protein [Candidatus Babeliales bacterium]|nr:RNA-binding protein [Candidatus Babeliales bacterium]MBP9844296.1 RNA-binding protein [Candidatus Babeliales bacterium]